MRFLFRQLYILNYHEREWNKKIPRQSLSALVLLVAQALAATTVGDSPTVMLDH